MTNDGQNITISLDRHRELERAENRLNALEAAGVDNWEGYSHTMSMLEDDDGR